MTLSIALFVVPLLSVSATPPARAHAGRDGHATSTSTSGLAFDEQIGALITPDGLTAEDVAARTARSSYEVEASRAALRSAAADVDRALAGYFPKLTVSARYARISDLDQPSLGNLVASPNAGPIAPGDPLVAVPFSFPVVLNQVSLDASLAAPLSDYILRIPRAYAAATHDERGADFTRRATERKVAADARALYYSWVRAELQQIVAREANAQARLHARDVKSLADAGTVSRADVLAVDAQVASSELLALRAKNLAERLAEQMRIAMHDPEKKAYAVGEDVRDERPSALDVGRLEALREEAFGARPELMALAETRASIEERRAISGAGYLPRLDAFADATYASPNPRVFPQTDDLKGTWQAGLRLAWTPSEIFGVHAERASLEEKANEVSARRGQVQDGISLEVMQSLQALSEATASVRTSARSLASAEEAYRVRRMLFQNGRATSVELTDSELALTRARLEVIDARINVRVARVRLAYAVGRDRPE